MGRVKRAMMVEIPEEKSGEDVEEKSEEELLADEMIAQSRAEDPKGAYEIVKRVDDATGEESWMGRWPVNVVTAEFLAKKMGRGKYVCYSRKPTGKNGRFVFAGNRTVNVGVDLREQTGGPPVVQTSGDFSRDLLLSMMKQGQENSQNMVTMMATMMTAMTTAMTALKPTSDPMLGAIVQGMMGRKDPTEIATALLGVMREGGATAKDPIEQIKSLLEIRDLLDRNGNDADPETTMILKGMDTLQSLFSGGRAFAPTPLPVARQLPAGAPVPVAAPVPELSTRREEPMTVLVDPTLRAWKRGVAENFTLLMRAAAFMPPAAAALTARDQMQMSGVWDDLVADVKSDGPGDADGEQFGDAFVERGVKDLQFGTLPPDVQEWAREVLYELAELAVEPTDEDEVAKISPETGDPLKGGAI